MMPPKESKNLAFRKHRVQTDTKLVRFKKTGLALQVMLSHALTTTTTTVRVTNQDNLQFYVNLYVLYITLKFEELTYSIKSQTEKGSYWFGSQEPKPNRLILNGVSGIVKPGELLAMLGPSGSGKTTLVTALAGRLQGKLSGTVSYNGNPFTSSVKRKTGFVTQDDVLYPHLTVMETLTYTALLCLPKELTRKEKLEQAEKVVSDLGLTRCCQLSQRSRRRVDRRISGGERKRVSIGQEMLVNPSLLLLDEPTSGLDSTTAARIVATLRSLARGGRTVVTTIHQPSSRLRRMFDKVLVLSEGCPIYSGDSGRVMECFGSIGYQPGSSFVNPADFVLDILLTELLRIQNNIVIKSTKMED